MALCTVSGVALKATGGLASGVNIHVVSLGGAGLIAETEGRPVDPIAADGTFSFTATQGSRLTVSGPFTVNGTDYTDGVTIDIPAALTALLADLGAVADFPDEGAIVQSSGVALVGKFGTFNFASGLVATKTAEGVAQIVADIGSAEAVRDALVDFFVDDGAYNWEVSDVLNKVSLVIAPATSAVNGLLAAADKTIIDALGATYAPIAHTHLAADITDFAAAVLLVAPAPAWGGITGTLSAQTDLQTALDLRSLTSHVHTFASLTSTPTTLAGYGIADAQGLNTKLTDFGALANAAGWLHNDGAGVFAYSTPSASDVGLGNVTNTSDANKPVSTAQQTALDLKADSSSLAPIALSGSASDLSVGTIPDARFPATLPAASGVNLTALNASNISSGTLDAARLPTGIDATKIAGGGVTSAEFDFLAGVTSDIQTQISAKANLDSPSFTTPTLGVANATSLTTTSLFVNGDARIGGGNYLYWQARSQVSSPADGVMLFQNQNTTDFSRLQFGGTSASFPSLKRSTTGLICRLADDSADAFFQALEFRVATNKVIGARGAALTVADAGAINSGDATTDTVIANMRTRIDELEARLGSAAGHGLFT